MISRKKKGRPKKRKPLTRILFVFGIFLILLVAGAIIYHKIEGWTYLDSIYFMVVTSTTIGYGDITPVTQMGKIFTMIFSFLGIATAFYLVSLIGSYFFKKNIKKETQKIRDKIREQEKKKLSK